MLPATNDSNVINSEIIEQYFLRSGKRIPLKKIKDMMDECGTQCGIEGFDSTSDIEFDTFYNFMTSFLVKE